MRCFQSRKIVGWAALAALFLSGCAGILTARNEFRMDASVRYKLDAEVIVRDKANNTIQKFSGMGVIRSAPPYNLKFNTPGKFSLIYVNTCARSHEAEPDADAYRYQYEPNTEIELRGDCPMTISGYDGKKGKHTFAFVDFAVHNPDLNLPGEMICNGQPDVGPVLACQTKAGVIMQLKFQEPTVIDVEDANPECAKTLNEDGSRLADPPVARTVYRFQVPRDVCTWFFEAAKRPDGVRPRAKLSTYGFDEYSIRDF